MQMVRRVGLGVMSLIIAIVLATTASATSPGGKGDIAYSTLGRTLAVRAIDPDGMGDHKISIGRIDAGDAEYMPAGDAQWHR